MFKTAIAVEVAEIFGYTGTLKPQAIPLDVKIILVGRTFTYHLLQAQDEEFSELFKVKADFDTRMACTSENINDFNCFLGTLCEKERLCHLDATAIAALLSHAMRLSGDQEKLSTQFGALADVVRDLNGGGPEAVERECERLATYFA